MPPDDHSPRSLGPRTVDRGDANLHTVGRTGNEPLVVLVHGLAGRGREWVPVVDALGPDVAVCLPDLRGHGASTRRPPISAEALVDDLVAVIEAWTNAPAVVVGQSLGGVAATLAAARHPDRVGGLVLGDIPDTEAARMHDLRPTTSMVVVDDVGHDVHLVAPAIVAELIDDIRAVMQ